MEAWSAGGATRQECERRLSVRDRPLPRQVHRGSNAQLLEREKRNFKDRNNLQRAAEARGEQGVMGLRGEGLRKRTRRVFSENEGSFRELDPCSQSAQTNPNDGRAPQAASAGDAAGSQDAAGPVVGQARQAPAGLLAGAAKGASPQALHAPLGDSETPAPGLVKRRKCT